MRTLYLYIIKPVTFFTVVCALLWTAVSPAGAGGDAAAQAPQDFPIGKNPAEAQTASSGESSVAVGLGRVLFEIGPTGRWLRLTPDWMSGHSVITGGGFVVVAVDENGEVVELANTATDSSHGLRVADQRADPRPVFEGIDGGARYPLAQRDDDGDGKENEDRLDGVDNDGDGRVDEDYAAVGDQMITLDYTAIGDGGAPVLQIHQECYTWTLPHIDAMVAMKLVLRNVSDRTFDNAFVCTVISRPKGFSVSSKDLSTSSEGDRLSAKGIFLTGGHKEHPSSPDQPPVAAVLFAEAATDDVSWLTGVASRGRRFWVDVVRARLTEGEGDDGAARPDPDRDDTDAPHGGTADQTAYGISPNLGTLAPGDEAVVYAAVLVAPAVEKVGRAVDDAFRTVIGDGDHRMIPPPVSVTRKSVWGTYKAQPGDEEGASAGVTIVLENARGQGIGAGDLLYLNGIDLAGVDASEEVNGDLRLWLKGELYEEIASTRGRVELHGRLRNGEFVDVLLNPAKGDAQAEIIDGVSEAQYWSRPGRLDDALLTGSPNPFRDVTTIYYEVPASVSDEDGTSLNFFNPIHASVKIYNVAGRLVSILVDTIQTPGQYNIQWNAVDDNGSTVASGVYYIKLQIGKKHVTKRLIQLK